MDKKTVETLVGKALATRGFKKKGTTWYREALGVLQVVNLQKSSWGASFYLNLAFVPEGMSVEGMPRPKEYKCPIRIRLDSAYPDKEALIEGLLRYEDVEMSDEQRTAGIEGMFHDMVLPFMDRLQTVDDLKRAIEGGTFHNASVILDARKHLGLPLK